MVSLKIPQSWLNRWLNLPPRDRLMLSLLAIILGVLLLVYGAMIPAHRYADQASQYYRTQTELLAWVNANAAKVESLPAFGQELHSEIGSESLLTLASGGAEQYQISFKRFEPNGDHELRIWLEKIPFNQLLLWLGDLKLKHGVKVIQANFDRRDLPGTVNARIVLSL